MELNSKVKTKDINEEEKLTFYSKKSGIPFEKQIIDKVEIKDPLGFPIQYFKNMGFVPLYTQNSTLIVAINNPLNFQAADDFARKMGCRSTRFILSTIDEIHSAINLLFDQSNEDTEKVVQDLESYETEAETIAGLEELPDLMDTTDEAPVIRLVNFILTKALKSRVSDIHIEPYAKDIKIRFRIDGILHEIFSVHKRLHPHIVSRIKIMSGLDIAEKRVPQDGKFKIKVANRTVDIRVSIIPMSYGERIVLRILDKSVSLLGLGEMGMSQETLQTFESLISKSHGMILVTGPTGSGKTTTLYAAISKINSPEKNIITIEDPIEYELKGVGQIQVNPKTNLTFAKGLRAILRHDPDVIMVGEIRDIETAEIAIQASMTGHLVFSTLHTNDAAGALTRLVDMGIEPFLIASSLMAVLAQRLVRKICPECKRPFKPDKAILEKHGLPSDQLFWHGTGCPSCMDSGYKGRTGVFELLVIDNEIRKLLTRGADSETIKQAAIKKGMTTLFEDGLSKVKKGITTLDEVLRVTQE